nr:hypothetical protein [Tanacetum cinerariifolium]
TDKFRRYCVDLELLSQIFEKSVVTDAGAGQIDCAGGHWPGSVVVHQAICNDLEDVLHHPTIQRGHHPVALGGRDEAVRQDHAPGLVAQ